MKKGQVIGLTVTVLAVIGGVAVYNWVRKPKKNSEGFFSADGYMNVAGRPTCVRTNADGSRTQYSSQGGARPCPYGGNVVASV